MASPPPLLILGCTREEGGAGAQAPKPLQDSFCEGFFFFWRPQSVQSAESEPRTSSQGSGSFSLLLPRPLQSWLHPPPILPSPSKDTHERRGVGACAGSDRGLLSRRQAVYLRSGGKALPGKEERRIPAEGKCIKAPDWRL